MFRKFIIIIFRKYMYILKNGIEPTLHQNVSSSFNRFELIEYNLQSTTETYTRDNTSGMFFLHIFLYFVYLFAVFRLLCDIW